MTDSSRSTLVGVFTDRSAAQRAVNELRRANFREDQIGIVARSDNSTLAPDAAANSKVAEGAAAGAATGAGIGALWALGIAAGMLPAIGPVIAGGLLMSVLASAGGAAAVGTLVGALVGLGIPENEATYYEGEFKAGRTLVTVKPEGRNPEAISILRSCGAYDMHSGSYEATMARGASSDW